MILNLKSGNRLAEEQGPRTKVCYRKVKFLYDYRALRYTYQCGLAPRVFRSFDSLLGCTWYTSCSEDDPSDDVSVSVREKN